MLVNNSDLLNEHRQLIVESINGDINAQNKLYKVFASKMFALCIRYSKSRHEAEEIMQEGFLKVFRSLKNFKFAGSFEGWVRKIMVYTAIQYFRNKSKLPLLISIE